VLKLVGDIPLQAREWRNDERIYRWCRQSTVLSQEAHRKWRERIENDPSIKMFGIETTVNKSRMSEITEIEWTEKTTYQIGVCGFTSIDRQNQSAEFSLYIAPLYQGQGHGKKALEELIRIGFKQMNLNRIWGETFDGNHALNMFFTVGMKSEGVHREAYYKNGKFINAHVVSILRSEYEEINKAI
jgi:RimJ/RimL family protein N-acetyltransferase